MEKKLITGQFNDSFTPVMDGVTNVVKITLTGLIKNTVKAMSPHRHTPDISTGKNSLCSVIIRYL